MIVQIRPAGRQLTACRPLTVLLLLHAADDEKGPARRTHSESRVLKGEVTSES